MKHQFRTWRLAGRVLAIALILAAVPLPCLAGDSTKPAPAPGLNASIANVAASRSVRLEQAKPASAPDKAELGSPSFFKKPIGIVVLALLGGGAGYMAYSMSHNRVHSVVRQNQ